MEQFPQEMGNQNTPAMSDHVVVKRELLVRLSSSAFAAASYADNAHLAFKHQDAATEAQKVLSAPSPEMVPWAEVEKLTACLQRYSEASMIPSDATRTLSAFNAKFKV